MSCSPWHLPTRKCAAPRSRQQPRSSCSPTYLSDRTLATAPPLPTWSTTHLKASAAVARPPGPALHPKSPPESERSPAHPDHRWDSSRMDSSLQRKPKLKVQEKQVKPPVQRSASSRTPYSESSIHCRSITSLARLNRRVNRVLEPGRYAFKWRLLTLIVCRGRRLKHTATTTVRTRRLTLRARRSRPSTTAYLRICHEGTQRTLEEHRSHWGSSQNQQLRDEATPLYRSVMRHALGQVGHKHHQTLGCIDRYIAFSRAWAIVRKSESVVSSKTLPIQSRPE